MIGWPTEDELVSTDELQEKIQEFEDYVQSTDIAAMQSGSSPFSSTRCIVTDLLYLRIVIMSLYFLGSWTCCMPLDGLVVCLRSEVPTCRSDISLIYCVCPRFRVHLSPVERGSILF